MLIIPAIDLKNGCVVRLYQGAGKEKVYSRDPARAARHWAASGARMLHVVDLDGALSGKLKNLEQLKSIIRAVDIPVEFGGGLRQMDAIKKLLGAGVWRVVLGTKAAEDGRFLKKACASFKGRVIASIDARQGKVLVRGWEKSGKGLTILGLAARLKKSGIEEAVYTDIAKDGTLSGPNIQGTKELLKASGLKLIASGGVSSLSDIRRLKSLEKMGLTGIIVGKALYEARFTLAEALKLAGS